MDTSLPPSSGERTTFAPSVEDDAWQRVLDLWRRSATASEEPQWMIAFADAAVAKLQSDDHEYGETHRPSNDNHQAAPIPRRKAG